MYLHVPSLVCDWEYAEYANMAPTLLLFALASQLTATETHPQVNRIVK